MVQNRASIRPRRRLNTKKFARALFLLMLPLALALAAVVLVRQMRTHGRTIFSEPDGGGEVDFLMLVNWENPVPFERPDDLVPLSDALGGCCTLQSENGSINETAGKAAREMFEAAGEEGVSGFYVTTAYRSVSYQQSLFDKRLAGDPAYGSDPYNDPVKVLPGTCSEHTTGLALDILAVDERDADDGFAETPEGEWLAANAHRFGFILRYPKDKQHITGVIFEPWHLRYVGREAAKEIYDSGVCLEEYLANR